MLVTAPIGIGGTVSVCMATFNGELYLPEQLSSILEQLSGRDELVISDDGSQDKTLEVIGAVVDPRITLLQTGQRRGIVGNFENALINCKNEYIFLADQDDVWLPGKVKACCDALRNVDVVVTDCRVIDGTGNELMPSFFKVRRCGPGFLRNLYKNRFVGCCMAVRRDFLQQCLPFPPRIHMHDWWIGLLATAIGRVQFIETPYVLYRRHAAAVSPTGFRGGYGTRQRFLNRLVLGSLLIWRIVHLMTRRRGPNWSRR